MPGVFWEGAIGITGSQESDKDIEERLEICFELLSHFEIMSLSA